MPQVVIENPVLNSPFEEPKRHFKLNEILKDKLENVEPSLAFSQDGKTLVELSPLFDKEKKTAYGTLHILPIDGRSEPTQYDLYDPSGSIESSNFALSPDTKLVSVSTTSGAIYFFDTSNGNLVSKIPAHQAHAGPILRLVFNQDGSLLASLERSGIIKIWGITP